MAESFTEAVVPSFQQGRERGVILQSAQPSEDPTDRFVSVGGANLLDFGTCGYLGISKHPSLTSGALRMLSKWGLRFPSSRVYAAPDELLKLEAAISAAFGGAAVVTANVTQCHLAAIPVIAAHNDLLLLDRQVHASVQAVAYSLAGRGHNVRVVPHNDIHSLEQVLASESSHFRRIWYFADGVYSMYGDVAPVDKLVELLNRYDKLHIYVDDAHGTGCTGTNGSGYVLDTLRTGQLHPRALVAFSLSKALCCAGGGIVGGDQELVEAIRMVGPGVVFSFSLTNPAIGAAQAAIDLSTSEEGALRRDALQRNIASLNEAIGDAGIQSAGLHPSPITYVPLGGLQQAFHTIEALKTYGFYVNIAAFPAVPKGQDGIRLTTKATHTQSDLQAFVEALQKCLPP